MGRILVVDDHDSLRKGLVRALANAGHDVEEAPNGTVAIERLQDSQFDVVLTDLRMGGADGMDVLRTTRSIQPSAAVILMTAFGSIHTAVEAMKIGAFDFVQKPFEIEEMELKIEKAIELRHLKYQVDYLRHEQQDIYDFDRIVGASGALQQVLTIVKKVARSNSTILIRGETGTGKELIAGAIHHNSLRANRAFVKVNCAALQENLLESELFGHEKGAFTGADKQRIGRFEQADGGTLFLDEVGDMSAEHAGEDPARAPGARVRAPRRHPHAARRRAHHRGDQPQPHDRWWPRAASAKTSSTGSTSSRSTCRRCATARKTSRRWPSSSCAGSRAS